MPLVMETRPAAYCVIVREGKILLTQYNAVTFEGLPITGWTLPGGGIEIGEQPEETAVREVAEETGYRVEINRLAGVHTAYFPHRSGDKVFCALRTVFSATVVGGDFVVETDGSTTDARWVPLADLGEYFPEYLSGDSHNILVMAMHHMGYESPKEWAATHSRSEIQEPVLPLPQSAQQEG